MKQFVLSQSEFESIRKAEDKVNEWYETGNLDSGKVKLYKVVEVYDLRLGFKKRK